MGMIENSRRHKEKEASFHFLVVFNIGETVADLKITVHFKDYRTDY